VRLSETGQITFKVQLPLPGGERWRDTIGVYGQITVDDARAAVQALAGDIARGVDPRQKERDAEAAAKVRAEAAAADEFTVGRLIERWKRDLLSTKRPNYAVRAYRNVERTFESLLGTPAAALTRADVRKALEAKRTQTVRRSAGRGNRNEGGPAAVHNAASSLHAAYRWALGEDLLNVDPLNGLKPQGRVGARDRTLGIDEARRIHAAACALPYPNGQFVRLLMLTGARRGEIAGLRWDEIDTEEDGDAIVLPPARTKTNSGHHVPLSQAAFAVIAECARHRVVGSPYVLTSDGWRNFANYNRVKLALDQALAADGPALPHWTFHDFRRTIVSTLARKPFRYNPVILDLLLGHQPTQLSPVARIYQREGHHDDRREALEAWGKHLTQAPATVTALHPEKKFRD
jgi:integrase